MKTETRRLRSDGSKKIGKREYLTVRPHCISKVIHVIGAKRGRINHGAKSVTFSFRQDELKGYIDVILLGE